MTTLLARPGRRPGALMAVGLDPRPCVVNPPQWWDTGNDGNQKAVNLCNTACPQRDTCKPERGEVGLIRGGTPYGDDGKPARFCDTCRRGFGRGVPHTTKRCEACRRAAAIKHHDQIMHMRRHGKSWAAIGRAVGCSESTIRHYVNRHRARQAAAA